MKMQNVKEPAVVMALNTEKGNLEETLIRDWISAISSHDAGLKRLLGCYKGDCETSWLVTLPLLVKERELVLDALYDLAARFNQESILYLDEYRNAELIFIEDYEDVGPVQLGKFKAVPESDAKACDSFTYDINAGVFYIAA